jgi:gas vesicle protein
MAKVSIKKIAVGAAIAAVGGYLAGILTASKPGKDTRKDIKNAVETGKNAAEAELKNVMSELNDVIEKAKDQGGSLSSKAKAEMDDLTDKAKVAKLKSKEVLTAVREGKAKDEDLNKAVANANRALNHLKDYLKK